MGDRRPTKIAKMMVLCWNLLPNAFVWAIYIYIESIEVTYRSTVVKIVLIGNLRWPSSCLYLLYFPATVLFTCIKSWFFRNHLANFHQISHWSYCWNVIDSLFKWLCSIDCQAHISFKTKNCSNDDLFIGCDDRMEKCCITSTFLQWLCHSGERVVAHGPLVTINTCISNERDVCLSWSLTAWSTLLRSYSASQLLLTLFLGRTSPLRS